MKQISRWMMAAVLMALLGGCSGEDGMLKISSDPVDAEIYIDGDRKGNTPSEKGQTFAIKISAGEHKVEIIKPIENPDKYDQYYGEKRVVVAEKSLQTVSLSLKKRQSEAYKVKWDEHLRLKAEAAAKATEAAIQSIESNMVTISAGRFQMGSKHEPPIHTVNIGSFKIGKYEITQEQWSAVMGGYQAAFIGVHNPIDSVSWLDVQKFIRVLNSKTGKKYRLPTEAEWEYAARAGSSSKWSWGNSKNLVSSYAWYRDNSIGKTHPVGQKKPNAFGLYDMHGNVSEWVQDGRHDSYQGAPNNGTAWLPDAHSFNQYTLRGGSWEDEPDYIRSASRSFGVQDYGANTYGFRLAHD